MERRFSILTTDGWSNFRVKPRIEPIVVNRYFPELKLVLVHWKKKREG